MERNYMLLSACINGHYKSVLVQLDEWVDADRDASAFFVPGATEVKEHGEIQMFGAVDYLDDVYVSD